MRHLIYVPINYERRILTFEMGADTGRLDQVAETPTDHEPWQVCTDPGQRYLYQQVRDEDFSGIATYRIDPATAALEHTGLVEIEDAACYVSTDRTGRFLFAAHLLAGIVTVHPISPDGVLGSEPTARCATQLYAHSIQSDPTNRFAYVPHVDQSASIHQFLFDATDGTLTPHEVPVWRTALGHGPRHYAFHPHLGIAYFNAEDASAIDAYRIGADGRLELIESLPTLPPGFTGRNSTASVRVHPSGRMLYVPNRGHDSIAQFAVDEVSGRLAPRGHVGAEACPRPVGIDPQGLFFYAGSDQTGRLSTYRIDVGCQLCPLHTYEVGRIVSWILPLDFPASGPRA